jgi:hypothetical protein
LLHVFATCLPHPERHASVIECLAALDASMRLEALEFALTILKYSSIVSSALMTEEDFDAFISRVGGRQSIGNHH